MPLKDDIEALLNRYVTAYRAGDAAGCAGCYTRNAEMHSPYGAPAHGRAAIEATHTTWLEQPAPSKTLDVVQAGGSGDLAWCLARFTDTQANEAGLTLAILDRQPDGGWLIRMSMLTDE